MPSPSSPLSSGSCQRTAVMNSCADRSDIRRIPNKVYAKLVYGIAIFASAIYAAAENLRMCFTLLIGNS